MSHNNQPEYFIINSICPHSGEVTATGIFEDMNAVSYRLKRMYTSCGDEYRIECFHLSTAESEKEAYIEQTTNRAKWKREEADKEAKLKEYDILKNGEPELPNINAEHKTVEV